MTWRSDQGVQSSHGGHTALDRGRRRLLRPPYPGVMSYEKDYRVIDEILEGASRPTSPFTAKGGAAMLDSFFERAGGP